MTGVLQKKGVILFIDPTKDASKTEGKSFMVRTFALDTTEIINGTPYASYAGFQCTGTKTEMLDSFGVGDEVLVSFSVSGTVKEKNDQEPTEQNTKSQVCFTNLNAWKIELIQKATQSGTLAPSTSDADALAAAEAASAGTKDDLPF